MLVGTYLMVCVSVCDWVGLGGKGPLGVTVMVIAGEAEHVIVLGEIEPDGHVGVVYETGP